MLKLLQASLMLALVIVGTSHANQPPGLPSISDSTVAVGSQFELLVKPTDPDGDVPSVSIQNAPTGVTFDDAGNGARMLRWTPTAEQLGEHVFIILAIDAVDSSLTASHRLIVTVENVGGNSGMGSAAGNLSAAQVLAPFADQQLLPGQPFSLQVSANSQGRVPALYLNSAPAGSSFDDNGDGTRTFRWTPPANAAGQYRVTVVAAFGDALEDTSSQVLRLNVGNTVTLPVPESVGVSITDAVASLDSAQDGAGRGLGQSVSQVASFNDHRPVVQPLADQFVQPGEAVVFRVTPVDPDGTAATLLVDPWPVGATFDDNGDGTRTFSWRPQQADIGSHLITFTAIDGRDSNLAHSESLVITVGSASAVATQPGSPVVVPNTTEFEIAPMAPRLANVDQLFTQRVVPLFPSGQSVPALVLLDGPSGSQFIDNGDGSRNFQWTPRSSDVGRHRIEFQMVGGPNQGEVANTTLTVDVGGSSVPVSTGVTIGSANAAALIGIESIAEHFGRPLNPVQFVIRTRHDGRPVPSVLVNDMPAGAELLDNGDGTRTFRWTPTTADVGRHVVTVVAVDVLDASLTASRQVRITILDDLPGSTTIDEPGTAPLAPASRADAARFLARATFGVTSRDIDELVNKSYEQWINDQLGAGLTSHRERLDGLLWNRGLFNIVSGENQLERSQLRADAFWDVVVHANDQLRQRVAFALSQIMVISDRDANLENRVRGFAHYHDILLQHSFGNFRDLLTDITLNPMMGDFLSSRRNEKPDPRENIQPDENYARELMQLFTIGLDQLDAGGRPLRDSSGNRLTAYTQNDVFNFARIFTGWNYGDSSSMRSDRRSVNSEIVPMKAYEEFHDSDPKELLNGVMLTGGKSAREDLDLALDNLFQHSNVGPFIARRLIQRLVTSNPSPAYVERVAGKFNNNGAGSRGDLAAVVKAILLDPEALNGHQLDPYGFGKLKEPIVKITSIWRAFDARGRFNKLRYADSFTDFAQQAYSAPSVFNFYSPDYRPPGPISDRGLFSPEAQILNESTVLRGANRLFDYAFEIPLGGDELLANQHQITLNTDTQRALAGNPQQLVAHLDELLLAGAMSDNMRNVMLQLVEQTPLDDNGKTRVQEALYLLFASPEFSFQR